MSKVEAKIVEVAIAQVKGFFSPTDAERAAAYELLIELTTRPSSTQLAAVDATISEELRSVEEMFEITRAILRKHGTDGSKGSGGNLSLAVVALRVLNDVFRPVINRWQPLLDDHMAQQPPVATGVTAAEWERRWERSRQCRAELNSMRASTRAYIETLSHIAGTSAIADSILSEPSSTMFPRTSVEANLHPPSMRGVEPRRKMVSWLNPLEMWQTWRAGFPAEKSLKRAVTRTPTIENVDDAKPEATPTGGGEKKVNEDDTNRREVLPTASFPAVANTDFWFDYVADMGDGFDGTAPVAWLMGRHSISVPDHRSNEIPTPPASMPRGELVVFGGDQVYPFAKAGAYQAQTELPYQMGLEPEPQLDADGNPMPEPAPRPKTKTEGDPEGTCTDHSPTLLSIPGNHDWLGGIEHYATMFTDQRKFAEHWQTVQRNNWFHAELPQGWWIWGIDTGLHNKLVGPQADYFRRAAKSLRPNDRVILCTPVPLWQLRQKDPEAYATLRATFDPLISGQGATMPLCLSGDTHFFAQFERVDTEVTEDHITAGGGGAFLQPTHNLPERVPLESGNAEFKLTSRWPPSADSRAIAPGAKRLFSTQYLPLILFAALAYTAYAALERLHIGQMWDVPVPSSEDASKVVAASSVEHLNWYQSLSWGVSWPLPTALLILIAWSGTLVFRGNSVEPKLGKAARMYGFVGGGAISAAFVVVNTTRLDLFHGWSTWWIGRWSTWEELLVAVGAAVAAGALSIGLLLTVVRWANRKISVNDSLAFLPAQSTRFKNFVRFRIDSDGDLTCYVVGIDPVGKGWYDAMAPTVITAPRSLPPHDPAGSPRVHYVWGKTYEKFNPTPVRVALSISDTGASAEEPSIEEQVAAKFLGDAFEHLGAMLLKGGHSMLFGGRPGEGYTERLHLIDKMTHGNNPNSESHLFNYVADYLWKTDTATPPQDRMQTVRVRRAAAGKESTGEREIKDLTAMRVLMTDRTDIRVVIGGSLGPPGEPKTRVAPGILEEAYLAVEAGLPLIVVGGFGGAAGLIGQAIMGRVNPQTVDELAAHFVTPTPLSGAVSFEQMLARFRSLGVLRNGLTDGENTTLIDSHDAATVSSLIMRSVHRVGSGRTS